jgi:hypothetical protein
MPGAVSETTPRSVSSASPVAFDTPATMSKSNVSPATAAASAAARASSESSDTPIKTASRMPAGSGTSPALANSRPRGPGVRAFVIRRARASSSTKNGTPCVRSWIARVSEPAALPSSTRSRSSPVSSAFKGSMVISSRFPLRRSSCRSRLNMWSRGRPSER